MVGGPHEYDVDAGMDTGYTHVGGGPCAGVGTLKFLGLGTIGWDDGGGNRYWGWGCG